MIAADEGVHTHTGCSFPVIWFTSETFPGTKLLATKRYIHVIAEGDPNKYFEATHANPPQAPTDGKNTGEEQGDILDFRHMGDLQEDNATVLAQGLIVDDDNEPAPENSPTAATQLGAICPATGLLQGQQWNWNGICNHKMAMQKRESASFNNWIPTDDRSLIFFFNGCQWTSLRILLLWEQAHH